MAAKKLNSNRLVALQFLVLVLPVVLLLLVQTLADGRRAAALEFSRPLRVNAQEARAQYKAFFIGVTDAVDTGSLNNSAYQALLACNTELQALVHSGADPTLLAGIIPQLNDLVRDLPKNADLATLLKLRDRMRNADEATQKIAVEFDSRDEAVMRDAIKSAHTQQIAVAIAIFVTAIMTLWFVLAAQRRLTERLLADQKIAEESLRLKNALNNCSAGIMVADPAGTIVYANRSVAHQLRVASPDLVKKGSPLEGLAMTSLSTHQFDAVLKGGRAEFDIGNRTFLISSDMVRAEDGREVGLVLEWSDRTEQAALEREVASIVEAAAHGEFDRRISMSAQSGGQTNTGFYGPLVSSINRLLETAEANLDDVGKMLEALAQGNLTQRIKGDYRGTFGKLTDYSNRTADRLEEIVGQIKSVAEAIDAAAGEIVGGNADLSKRTEEQLSDVQSTAHSMAEMTEIVRGTGDQARSADQLAAQADTVASNGGEVVTQIIRTMTDISAASLKISDIIGVIDGLAFQTNILALNAAVEAARAGEHGRGFAVVAAEVRNLAGRSAEAARQIRTLIGASVKTVSAGTTLVNSAGTSMADIVAAIARVSAIVRGIAQGSARQTEGVELVDRAIARIDNASRQNAALVQHATEAAHSLEMQAALLVDSVAVFRLNAQSSELPSSPGVSLNTKPMRAARS
jgi:methyl-accepting chemotaxis protein